MRVLLTNDDGIRAPGIEALHRELVDPTTGGQPWDVLVVAPLTVQSATSHGVTFHEPLMIREERVSERMTGIAVDGRPADCMKLALAELWPERFGPRSLPDLVVSGMNAGANAGINVLYSGTVAAALEAAFLGVPSIAVSLHLGSMEGGKRTDFVRAARRARRAIELVLARGLPDRHECVSINVPRTEEGSPVVGDDDFPPVRVCPMNTHGLVDRYERRVNPSGQVYFWAAGHGLDFHGTEPGSDVDELLKRSITVTPLRYDMTRHDRLAHWARVVGHSGAASTPSARA